MIELKEDRDIRSCVIVLVYYGKAVMAELAEVLQVSELTLLLRGTYMAAHFRKCLEKWASVHT